MKGLAKLAWIALLLGMGVLSATTARAAAPRDAIRKLPSMETSMRWITQNDNEELFQSIWKLGWSTGDIRQGRLQTRLNFNYELNLQDNQNASGNFTRSIRQDYYDFRVELKSAGYLNGNYFYSHRDVSSNQFPSNSDRDLELTDYKAAYLELKPDNAPRFTFTTSERTTSNQNGYNFSRGSDDIYWKGFAESSANTPQGGYRVQFHNESRLTRDTFSTDGQQTSQETMRVIGERNMQIGNMGRLQMSANYWEDSSRNSLQENASTQSDLQYALNFGGDLPGYPMHYDYIFRSRHWGPLANPSNRSMEREVRLRFNPPVPAGREMSVAYSNRLLDYNSANDSTATTIQQINVGFRPNKLTTASLLYQLQNDFSNISNQLNKDETLLNGRLEYKAPGGISSYGLGFEQKLNGNANRLDRNEYTKYSYSAGSRLGRQANLRMEISQAFNDSFNSQNQLVTPTDTLQTRVYYDFSGQAPGGGGGTFNLGAEWIRSLVRRELSQQKSDNHTLNLNLSYNTNANWRYELHLNSNSGWAYQGFSDFSDRYSNSDRIEAKVSHVF
ncbi:hypothetical protein KDL44_09245 [bacterium]|nr:hypothetical protein [bacterium]